MELSVVIPVRNRPDAVALAVRAAWASLRRAELDDTQAEVVVVDNASIDHTPRAAAEAGARVVREPAGGRTRARNTGAAEACGRWIAFIDSDCEPEPDWARELLAAIRAQEARSNRPGAVAGMIRDSTSESVVVQYLTRRRWFDQRKYLERSGLEPFAPRFALTANLAVHRATYLELGGLDPELMHAVEDAEFCLRLADAGRPLDAAEGAIVVHHHRADVPGLWRQAVDWGAGQAEMFAKWHARWGRRMWIEPRHHVWALKGLLKTPWRLVCGRTPFERMEPWLDCVANAGLAWGRLTTGLRKRRIVI